MLPFQKFDPIYLHSFFQKLENEGFEIDIDDRIHISQLMVQFFEGEIKNLSELKTKISAFVSQSDTQQDRFYELFDLEIERIYKEIDKKKVIPPPHNKYLKWFIYICLGLGIYIATMLWIKERNTHYIPFEYFSSEQHRAVNNELVFFVPTEHYNGIYTLLDEIFHFVTLKAFEKHYKKNEYIKTIWDMGDKTIYKDSFSVFHTYKDTGRMIIQLHYTTPIQDTIHYDTIDVCDELPIIEKSNKKHFLGEPDTFSISNYSGQSIIWRIDDTIFKKTKSSQLIYKSNTIGWHQLLAVFENQKCTHKINQVDFEVQKKEDFWIKNEEEKEPISENKILITPLFWRIIGILSFFSLLGLLLRYYWDKIKKWKLFKKWFESNYISSDEKEKIQADLSEIFASEEPPFELEFSSKDRFIHNDVSLSKLFSLLNLSTNSDRKILDVFQTIKNTTKNWGLFTPRFKEVKTKRTFIFIIEDSYTDSIQVKLFQYLLSRMLEQQIDIDSYYYFEDPDIVYKKDSETQIPLNQLKEFYYDSICIVIGNGFSFIDSENPKITPSIETIYRFWANRILITPIPANDWSINEKVLSTFFKIIPADIIGLIDLVQVIQSIESKSELSPEKYLSYSIKYKVFEDINELRLYFTGQEHILEWVHALAIYPRITWELILTVGRAIEVKKNTELLTYENLLKIVRIDWVRQGHFSSRLRLDLLKSIDISTEIAVRESIIDLLESTPANRTFLSNQEKETQLIINKYILYSHSPSLYPQYEEAQKQFLILYQNSERPYSEKKANPLPELRDNALAIYLQKNDPDYPPNEIRIDEKSNWSTPIQIQNANTSIDAYLDSKLGGNQKLNVIEKWLKICSNFLPLLLMIFLIYSFFSYKNRPNSLFAEKEDSNHFVYTNFKLNDCLKKFNPQKLEFIDQNDNITTKVFDTNQISISMNNNLDSSNYNSLKLKIYNDKNDVIEHDLIYKSNLISINSLDCNKKNTSKALVYLQYFPPSYVDSMRLFQQFLRSKNYDAPGIEYQDNFKKTEVRYFNSDVGRNTDIVSEELSQFFNIPKPDIYLASHLVKGDEKINQIEIWIHKPLKIAFYSKSRDGGTVRNALNKLDKNLYQTLEGTSKLNTETNTVFYYHPKLKNYAIEVAKKLIEVGIPIRAIYYIDNKPNKLYDIEVGYNYKFKDNSVIKKWGTDINTFQNPIILDKSSNTFQNNCSPNFDGISKVTLYPLDDKHLKESFNFFTEKINFFGYRTYVLEYKFIAQSINIKSNIIRGKKDEVLKELYSVLEKSTKSINTINRNDCSVKYEVVILNDEQTNAPNTMNTNCKDEQTSYSYTLYLKEPIEGDYNLKTMINLNTLSMIAKRMGSEPKLKMSIYSSIKKYESSRSDIGESLSQSIKKWLVSKGIDESRIQIFLDGMELECDGVKIEIGQPKSMPRMNQVSK